VRGRRDRRSRRAAKDEALAASIDQEGDVRVALADPLWHDIAGAESLRVEVLPERFQYQKGWVLLTRRLVLGVHDVCHADGQSR
jgi:hypothetical protein